MHGAVMNMVLGTSSSLHLFIFFFVSFSWCALGGPMTGSMVAKETPKAIKFILDEKDFMKIQEELNIPASIKLKLSGPFERVTMGSVTQVVLYEEMFRTGLRLLLPAVVTKLLRWCQVCPI